VIAIINYGVGNLGAISNMCKRLGVAAEITADLKKIKKAGKIILPGVGAFDSAMERFNQSPGLRITIEKKVFTEKTPVLGVCLGMQMMARKSEEGQHPGLGWIDAEVFRFPKELGLKIPHMGWNVALPAKPSVLLKKVDERPRYYFVHSFYVKLKNQADSLMRSKYGLEFDSGFEYHNIFGVQFHPEKSHRFGMQILKNFSELEC